VQYGDITGAYEVLVRVSEPPWPPVVPDRRFRTAYVRRKLWDRRRGDWKERSRRRGRSLSQTLPVLSRKLRHRAFRRNPSASPACCGSPCQPLNGVFLILPFGGGAGRVFRVELRHPLAPHFDERTRCQLIHRFPRLCLTAGRVLPQIASLHLSRLSPRLRWWRTWISRRCDPVG
jgi:hypothetical protein